MKTKRLFPILGVLAVLASVTACSSSSGELAAPGQPDLAALDTDQFAVVDQEDVFATIQDASVDTDMTWEPVMDGTIFHRHRNHPGHLGSHLRHVLHELGITFEQLELIRGFVRDHIDRIIPELRGLREVNQPIIEEANRKRMAIVKAYRNGDITREEAARMLIQLMVETHLAIRNNPDNLPFLTAICESKKQLFADIRSVLTDGQQSIWDAWVARLGGPCFGV